MAFEALNDEVALEPGMQGGLALASFDCGLEACHRWRSTWETTAASLSPESDRGCLWGERGRATGVRTEPFLPARNPRENFFPGKHQGSLGTRRPQEPRVPWSLGWEAHIRGTLTPQGCELGHQPLGTRRSSLGEM